MWTPDIRFYVIEAYLKYSLNVQIIDLPVSPLRIFPTLRMKYGRNMSLKWKYLQFSAE